MVPVYSLQHAAHLQRNELVVVRVDRYRKVQARIAFVHNFEVPPLDKVAQLRAAQAKP